jgi:general secretion pathway protein M
LTLRAGSFTSRFVALALLAFVLLAVFQLIAAPMLTAYQEVARTIELSQGLLYRYRALSLGRAHLAARFEVVEKTATRSVAYITESSNTLAGAALQNHVRNIVERGGGELHSSQILPVESIQLDVSVRRVALKLKVLVEVGRLQHLIYNVETAKPFVFIRELSILGVTEAQDHSDTGTKPMLELRLQVYGFMRAPSIVRGPTALQDVSRL